MFIRKDEVDRVSIDKFVSTSGKFLSVLAERYEPAFGGLRGFYVVVCDAATLKVLKVVRLAIDDAPLAYCKWDDWRLLMTAPAQLQEQDIPTALTTVRWSPPFITEEDSTVLKMIPTGARVFVRDITPVDSITARAEAAGLTAVIAEENKPRPTMGIVISVGEDPLAQELYKPGMFVLFSKHSGNCFNEAGQEYRSLELFEIIGKRRPEDGIDDLIPAETPAKGQRP